MGRVPARATFRAGIDAMISKSESVGAESPSTGRSAADFMSLTKPRIILMVVFTVAAAFYLASGGRMDYLLLFHSLAGIAMATGGSLTLNQAAEEDIDFMMNRTRLRPLPDQRLHHYEALAFGISLLVAGNLYLIFFVNPLTAFLTALTGMMYLLLYTPLKRISSWNTIVGAIPGAMPPVLGWSAAMNSVPVAGWILFSILFVWQIPHALAIGVLYRDEFRAAGVRLLPVEDPDGRKTGFHVVNYCIALIPIGMMPTLTGMAGPVYFFLSLFLAFVYLGYGIQLARKCTVEAARHLFFVSLIYLPVSILVMVLDHGQF
jgi:protoheme IX farnesyltransferase